MAKTPTKARQRKPGKKSGKAVHCASWLHPTTSLCSTAGCHEEAAKGPEEASKAKGGLCFWFTLGLNSSICCPKISEEQFAQQARAESKVDALADAWQIDVEGSNRPRLWVFDTHAFAPWFLSMVAGWCPTGRRPAQPGARQLKLFHHGNAEFLSLPIVHTIKWTGGENCTLSDFVPQV